MKKCLKFDKKKYGKILVAIAVFIGGAMFLSDFLPTLMPGRVNIRMVYTDTFNLPLNQVRNLKGGGAWWQGGDLWLCFESDKDVAPLNKETYEEIPIEVAQAYFLQLLSDKQDRHLLKYLDALNDSENLKCRYAFEVDPSSKRENHRWFLHNIQKKTYYYREWSKY